MIKLVVFFACILSNLFLRSPRAEENGGNTEKSGYGLLWIEVSPSGASIFLDDVLLDQSVWLISTAPGEHEISLSKNGYQSVTEPFEIKAGQNLKLKFDLLPARVINDQDSAHLNPSR